MDIYLIADYLYTTDSPLINQIAQINLVVIATTIGLIFIFKMNRVARD